LCKRPATGRWAGGAGRRLSTAAGAVSSTWWRVQAGQEPWRPGRGASIHTCTKSSSHKWCCAALRPDFALTPASDHLIGHERRRGPMLANVNLNLVTRNATGWTISSAGPGTGIWRENKSTAQQKNISTSDIQCKLTAARAAGPSKRKSQPSARRKDKGDAKHGMWKQ